VVKTAQRTTETAWLIGALVAAAGLRFAALGQKPLWCDELATLQRLSLPFLAHVREMKGNHPLFELLLRVWMPAGGSDAWMRVPSAVLGVLAVWMTWRLARGVGARQGLLAAWLMALSPLAVMYSRIARAYSLACTLALASTLALVWAIRRRSVLSFLTYALATALMVYANLFAAALWIAQALFVLWFHRRRIRKLGAWVVANLGVAALLAPWLWYSLIGAVTWSTQTRYTALQLGVWAKTCYLPLTLCLGETVNPLNFPVVLPAFIGFGVALASGIIAAIHKRRALAVLFLVQIAVVGAAALGFSAIGAKHLTILLPAWCALIAIGMLSLRPKWLGWACGALVAATTLASLFNYFADRQFADADMVTPWRQIAATVERSEKVGDALIIGYHPDRGVYDIFRKYYRGKLEPQRLDFSDWRKQLTRELLARRTVWLLLHDSDPWPDIERWMDNPTLEASGSGAPHSTGFEMKPFQIREHTLTRLQAGFFFRAPPGQFQSPLYRLYRIPSPSRP